MTDNALPGSFRDPAGFMFIHDGILMRRIHESYKYNYRHLMDSGLYDELISQEYLVKHQESQVNLPSGVYTDIVPTKVPFISYPYEWSFTQLKNAALLTLDIQNLAMKYDMSLKDASAFNIQFINGKPILIDTLSFEKIHEGVPWIAYQQFCKHFLAPLALMSQVDICLVQLSKIYIDGVPLDLASKLLPRSSYFKFGILAHLHLHAKAQARYSDKSKKDLKSTRVKKKDLENIIDSLKSSVNKMFWNKTKTEWDDYYEYNNNYTSKTMELKKNFVLDSLKKVSPDLVWDLGSNTGYFSRLASSQGIETISFDIDHACVESNYKKIVDNGEINLLPLYLDLTNPSPGIGWDNKERYSFLERGHPQLVFALALIHHLAISNNLPLGKLAKSFFEMTEYLLIEFVPKSDSMVKHLLSTREDIFLDYHESGFEDSFCKYFKIISKEQIVNSERIMYLMRRI